MDPAAFEVQARALVAASASLARPWQWSAAEVCAGGAATGYLSQTFAWAPPPASTTSYWLDGAAVPTPTSPARAAGPLDEMDEGDWGAEETDEGTLQVPDPPAKRPTLGWLPMVDAPLAQIMGATTKYTLHMSARRT